MRLLASVASFAFAGLFGVAAFAADPVVNPTIGPGSIRVNLEAQNNSGESGTATLTQTGPDVVVVLAFADTGLPAQPAHIHTGSCAKLNPAPAYPLASIVKGQSTTTLKNLTLASLQNGNFAVNVHASASDAKTYVACGNIPQS
jgi:hypothetical protein